jgi:tetratricopeptide (TPR) repeat protein
MLFYLARHEESLAELRWALEIDPFSIIINLDYVEGLRCARIYQDAIAQSKKTLELNPDFVGTHQKLGKFYMTNGNYAEAG